MDTKDSQSENVTSLVDVWTTLSANGIALSKQQMDDLERYHNELRYWNERVNMISRKDMESIWERHIVHSLCLLKYVSFKTKARVLDVGTGGGLPGIPLKIARPDLRVVLVDSIAKKMKIVRMFAQHTDLKNIGTLTARVEDLANDAHYRRAFDVIVSRAVAPVSKLIEWTRPLLAPGGFFVFLKGGDLSEEIGAAQQLFPDLKVTVKDIELFGLPQFKMDEKKVVVCEY